MKDICVELINKLFGALGFVETLWRLFWEIVWPPYDLKNIEGQTVLIAGVNEFSKGLGKRLAKRGANLVFWDPNGDLLDDLTTEFEANDIEIAVQTVNMASSSDVKKAAEVLAGQHKFEVEILIHATGVTPQFDWLKEDDEFIDKMVDTNLKSCFWLTRAFMPVFMQRRSGHVVTIASTCGVNPTPHIPDYAACQAALVGFMKSLEVDSLARGLNEIQFTTLSPTFVNSEFFKEAKFSGKILWDRIEIDETCDEMEMAILTNKHSLILPWQDALLSSLQMVLSSARFYKVVARRWLYPQKK